MLGSHGQSNTEGKVIITIETVPDLTDKDGLEYLKSDSLLHSPFYREIRINIAKIINISDLENEHEYTTATIFHHNNTFNLSVNTYFELKDYDILTNYLTAYQYKIPVVEKSSYVARNYNGVKYQHYPSGLIKEKQYYKDGIIHSKFLYRDDIYNSLEYVQQFNQEILVNRFDYDQRESLIKQIWYDSHGNVYTSNELAKKGRPPTPRFPPPSDSPPPVPSESTSPTSPSCSSA